MSFPPPQGEEPVRGERLSPAVVALLLQAIAFTAALGIWHGARAAGIGMALIPLSVAQGLFAAALSRYCRQAPWWPFIHFLFPVATVAGQGMHWPEAVFLAAFLLLAGIFSAAHRNQIPYYPCGKQARRDVLAMLPSGPLRFIDIGSGTGGLSLHLARRRPDSSFSGIEIAPLPWLASVLRGRLTSRRGEKRVNFTRGDYRALDLSRHDVVFAYLSPPAMPALWKKCAAEMREGSLLLSYEFCIPGVGPDFAGAPDRRGRRLFGWRMSKEIEKCVGRNPSKTSQVYAWRAVMQEEPGKSLLAPRSCAGRSSAGWIAGNKESQRGRAC